MRFDYLVVGAGFTGAVLAERLATQLGKRVLIVERRRHIGGNAYDLYDNHGVLVHKYGPHIFHTNSKKVWNYLSQFTEWRVYYHKVRALVEGKEVPLPFNLNSIRLLFPSRLSTRLEEKLIQTFGYGARVAIRQLKKIDDPDIRFLADYVYKNVFESYTLKQWGLSPEELDQSVTARVPILVSKDDRYFQDTFQAVPKHGYTALFERMLSHKNICLLLGLDWREVEGGDLKFDRVIFTGPIDEFFGFLHGRLPYRSLRFEFTHHEKPQYQSVAQMNYPNDFLFTRITEFKHITGQSHIGTTVAVEYPEAFVEGENEPYYPIPREENYELYSLYEKEAAKLRTVLFVGRLADYRYYNMDQAVARALKLFEEVISNE